VLNGIQVHTIRRTPNGTLRSQSFGYNRYPTTTYSHGTNMPYTFGMSVEPRSLSFMMAFIVTSLWTIDIRAGWINTYTILCAWKPRKSSKLETMTIPQKTFRICQQQTWHVLQLGEMMLRMEMNKSIKCVYETGYW
jgi:hypothetical protein